MCWYRRGGGVCVCVCVCLYVGGVCECVCLYVGVWGVCVCVYIRMCLYVWVCMCLCVCMYVSMCEYLWGRGGYGRGGYVFVCLSVYGRGGWGPPATCATAASVAYANTVNFSLSASALIQRNDMLSPATRRISSVARLMALASEPISTVNTAAWTPGVVVVVVVVIVVMVVGRAGRVDVLIGCVRRADVDG